MKFSIMRSIDTKRYPSLIGQSVEDLERLSVALGQPSFRGRQLFDWIYRKKVDDLTKMTDLPKLLQEKLKLRFYKQCRSIKLLLGVTIMIWTSHFSY